MSARVARTSVVLGGSVGLLLAVFASTQGAIAADPAADPNTDPNATSSDPIPGMPSDTATTPPADPVVTPSIGAGTTSRTKAGAAKSLQSSAQPIQSASAPIIDPNVADGSTPPVSTDTQLNDLDWSLALRGSYTADTASGDRFTAMTLPSVTYSHNGRDLSYHATADGQFSKTGDGAINVDVARLSAGSALQFDPESSLTTNASVSVTQEDRFSPDVASTTLETPKEYSGAVDATYAHSIARFNLSATANAGRDVYGPTTLTDNSLADNSDQNNTVFGGGLRVGYQLTPVLEPFVSGNVTRMVFDAPSPVLSTKLDGNLYTLLAGVSAKWGSTLTASASGGVGYEQFDDPTIATIRATLYDANLTYQPNSSLTLKGDFATTVGAPGPTGSGSAKVEYAATASANYLVNEWLGWRASAGWNNVNYADSTSSSSGYNVGVGADYNLTRHTQLSADYGYTHAEATGSATSDAQTVTLGMTFKK